jgi:ABC-type multidrug transport system fused ATPase/permease subunit
MASREKIAEAAGDAEPLLSSPQDPTSPAPREEVDGPVPMNGDDDVSPDDAAAPPPQPSPLVGDAHLPNLEHNASCFSCIFFSWVSPTVKLGVARPLQHVDMPALCPEEDCQACSYRFSRIWRAELQNNPTPSLLRALLRFEPTYWIAVCLSSGFAVLTACGPLTLRNVVAYVNDPQAYTLAIGIVFALLMLFPTLVASFLVQHSDHMMNRLAMRVRGALIAQVFEKSLRLSQRSAVLYPVGHIANLISNDCQRPVDYAFFINWMYSCPIIIFINVGVLGWQVGWATVPAVGTMVVIIATSSLVTKYLMTQEKMRGRWADARMKALSEVISGMQCLKLHAWETPFLQKIGGLRDVELHFLKRVFGSNAVSMVVGNMSILAISIVLFSVYTAAMGMELTPEKAFTVLGCIYSMQVPFLILVALFPAVSNCRVSMQRLEVFLISEERDAGYVRVAGGAEQGEDGDGAAAVSPAAKADWLAWDGNPAAMAPTTKDAAVSPPLPLTGTSGANGGSSNDGSNTDENGKAPIASIRTAGPVVVRHASFAWTSDVSAPVVLHDVNLNIAPGALVAVVGQVGSGKTALLTALIGDMSWVTDAQQLQHHKHELLQQEDKQQQEKHQQQQKTENGNADAAAAANNEIMLAAVAEATAAAAAAWCVQLPTSRVAYVSQTPWILNSTVRYNITVAGNNEASATMATVKTADDVFDSARYEMALDVCCLREDLALLPAGDLTEIGERGTNLSGGQKQRIALCRAVYSRASVYLLDDALSAVDALVAERIFTQCIRGPGMAGATRLFVTHSTSFLSACDSVVMLSGGQVVENGHYDELILKPGVAERIGAGMDKVKTATTTTTTPAGGNNDAATAGVSAVAAVVDQKSEPLATNEATAAAVVKVAEGSGVVSVNDVDVDLKQQQKEREQQQVAAQTVGKLVQTEMRVVGTVESHIVRTYIAASKSPVACVCALLSFLFIVETCCRVSSDGWLSAWTSEKYDELNQSEYIYIYLGLIGGYVLMTSLRIVFMSVQLLRISRTLHDSMVVRVMRCAMSFFESTPTGRILARFSRDVLVVDILLPENVFNCFQTAMYIIMTVGLMCAVYPWLLLLIALILLTYYRIQKSYRANAREVQRLESLHRAPILSHACESLGGVSIIRAYNLLPRFRETMLKLTDANTIALYSQRSLERWLAIRLESMASVIGAAAALAAVITAYVAIDSGADDRLAAAMAADAAGTGTSESARLLAQLLSDAADREQYRAWLAGLTGVSLAYANTLPGMLNWMIRQMAEVEIRMNSVERIHEYCQLPVESAAVIHDGQRPTVDVEWPRHGAIEFRDLSVRYRADLPLAIRNISLAVAAGQKIGVVGRTGSGKSTLISVLFRLVEIAEGCVFIDGRDIRKMGLDDLRRHITIIPQVPTMQQIRCKQ